MLVDQAIIYVKGGKGGDGKVSFARFKYIPKGGPDGGDGGDGGTVRLIATKGVDTLLDVSGRHHWNAQDGEPGGSRQCAGRNGADLDIRLPPGTLVYDDATGELIGDLDSPGKTIVIAKGGRGGFGNEHFVSPTNQTPTTATPGESGEERTLRLELKLIADVGLVGKPNAGKSTLLSVITHARPKIANYPFTTLEPNLGIAELPSRSATESGSPVGARRLVVADIPGLIEGAHEGRGLGIEFLRHVERTRAIVHLLEIEPADGSDPVTNFHTINRELASYSAELASKPQVVVATKMDLLATPQDRAAARELLEQELGVPVLTISSASREGLRDVLEACWEILHPTPGAKRLTMAKRSVAPKKIAAKPARANKAAKPKKPAAKRAKAKAKPAAKRAAPRKESSAAKKNKPASKRTKPRGKKK